MNKLLGAAGFGVSALIGLGLYSGALEARNPFANGGLQTPLGINGDRVQALKEDYDAWRKERYHGVIANTTQLEFIATRIQALGAPYCPDGKHEDQMAYVAVKGAQVPICLDVQIVTIGEAAGKAWLQLTPTLPAVKGKLPADLNATFEGATPIQCVEAVTALSHLAGGLLRSIDSRSGKEMIFPAQIIFNPGGTNPCDQAPPIVQHPLQGGGPH